MSQTKPDRPVKRVKITLSPTIQSKCLSLLAEHFDIKESYPNPHVIYVQEQRFVAFLFAAQKEKYKLTLEQLNAEYVDMKKEPMITVVRGMPGHFYNHQPVGKIDELLQTNTTTTPK